MSEEIKLQRIREWLSLELPGEVMRGVYVAVSRRLVRPRHRLDLRRATGIDVVDEIVKLCASEESLLEAVWRDAMGM